MVIKDMTTQEIMDNFDAVVAENPKISEWLVAQKKVYDGCGESGLGCQKRMIGERIASVLKAKDEITARMIMGNGLFYGSPRPPCEDCYKEHIAKAIININESLIGGAYPKHRWLAIANLAEASAEILGLNPTLAKEIRDEKIKMVADASYVPDLMKYL